MYLFPSDNTPVSYPNLIEIRDLYIQRESNQSQMQRKGRDLD